MPDPVSATVGAGCDSATHLAMNLFGGGHLGQAKSARPLRRPAPAGPPDENVGPNGRVAAKISWWPLSETKALAAEGNPDLCYAPVGVSEHLVVPQPDDGPASGFELTVDGSVPFNVPGDLDVPVLTGPPGPPLVRPAMPEGTVHEHCDPLADPGYIRTAGQVAAIYPIPGKPGRSQRTTESDFWPCVALSRSRLHRAAPLVRGDVVRH